MNRRQALFASLYMLGCSQSLLQPALAAQPKAKNVMPAKSDAFRNKNLPRGHLMIIGGAEDRTGEKVVLRRFVELAKGDDPQISVITAASAFPQFVWPRYQNALTDLGVGRLTHVEVSSQDEANDLELAAMIARSDGVLLTGGDQRRLMNLIGGTEVARAIEIAYRVGGACVAGSSAGAAAMSQDMLAGRMMADGIGLLRGAVIDQHFSERRRLSRLVSAVAKKPRLIGIGIDEDTALIINKGQGFEVIGSGGVTMVDGRKLPAPLEEMDPERVLMIPELRVYQLPNGVVHKPGSPPKSPVGLEPGHQAAVQALATLLPQLASDLTTAN